MSIFIDTPQQWPGRLSARLGKSSHLVTDGEAAELAEFAKRIGLLTSWIQCPGTWREHYDVFGDRIARAIHCGAKQIDRKGFVNILRVKRGATPLASPKSSGGACMGCGCVVLPSGRCLYCWERKT